MKTRSHQSNFGLILLSSIGLHALFAIWILFFIPKNQNHLPVEVTFGISRSKKLGTPAKGNGIPIRKASEVAPKVVPEKDQDPGPVATPRPEISEPGTGTGNAVQGEGISGGEGGGVDTPLSRYLQKIVTLIEKNKQYPKKARFLAQEGTVLLKIAIDKTGSIKEVKVIQAPSSQILVAAAKQIMKKIKKFPEIPADVLLEDLSLTVPIHYKLEN